MHLQCEHLTVAYRLHDGAEITALDQVSLAIAPGEQLAIVGPNGSGKSTLALCLANLITPTAGTVNVRGIATAPAAADPAGSTPHAAIVFQTPDDNLVAETVTDAGQHKTLAAVLAAKIRQAAGLPSASRPAAPAPAPKSPAPKSPASPKTP